MFVVLLFLTLPVFSCSLKKKTTSEVPIELRIESLKQHLKSHFRNQNLRDGVINADNDDQRNLENEDYQYDESIKLITPIEEDGKLIIPSEYLPQMTITPIHGDVLTKVQPSKAPLRSGVRRPNIEQIVVAGFFRKAAQDSSI